MKVHFSSRSPGQMFIVRWFVAVLLTLMQALVNAQEDRPNVAILVYDGVQVIDHAVPFEVFGQFSLNNVYLVAADRDPISTYMGMQVVPNYSFADAPMPDVLVLPGGDAGEAQSNQDIVAWVDRIADEAEHVLTICTGIFFLAENNILSGKQITTWYDRQEELQRMVPEAEVVSDRVVVESGKLVSSAGLGVDGALRVLTHLHGKAWTEVVRLNMEHQPIPDEHHVPRAELADMKLPGAVYSAFPWRDAELLRYEGDRDHWNMDWRFNSGEPLDSLIEQFRGALDSEDNWNIVSDETSRDGWASQWTIEGTGESGWWSKIRLRRQAGQVEFRMNVVHQKAK